MTIRGSVARNSAVLLLIAIAWIFFFVLNPWFSFLNLQGAERLPRVVYFGLPAVLAAIAIFMTVGSLGTRVALALCLSMFGVVAGIVPAGGSSESAFGRVMFAVISVPTFTAGVAVAAVLAFFAGRTVTENIAWVGMLVAASFLLPWASFSWVPLEWMRVIDRGAIPLLLGLVAGYALAGPLLLKLALLVLVPASHVLVLMPTPEVLVVVTELMMLWVGGLLGHAAGARAIQNEKAPRSAGP